MEGVGEAVGLVPEALQHEERLGLAGHVDRLGPPGHVHLLEPLGQRGDRDLRLQAQFPHDALGHRQLALAAVDDEQLRRVGEPARAFAPLPDRPVALGQVGREATGQDLFHRRVVVVAGDVLDLEAAVVALLGQAVLHHHHRPDVIGALEVRHVVALDAQRRFGERQQVLELIDGPGPAVVVRGPAQAVPGELLLRVAGDRVQQAALVAPLGHADVHAGVALDGQPLLVDLLRLRSEREQHLLRHAERGFVAVQLLEDPGGEAVVVELLDLVEDEPLPAHDPPPSHVEDLDGRFQVILCDADDVEVLVAVGHHLLLGDGLLHRRKPVPHAGRPLVLLLVGGGSHLTIEALDDGVGFPIEEVDELLDQSVVPGVVDLADARSRALLDVEEEARPAEPVVLVVLARRTGADGEAPQQQVERVPDGVGVGVRPEVADALALAAPDDHGPGPLVVQGDGQERVALVVPQAHVEPGTVLLDEAVLEHERLDLVAHLHPLDRGRRGHHLGGARMQPGRILEVAAHP